MGTPPMSPSKASTAASKASAGADLARMRRAPTHPGEIFEEEYRKPSGISQAEAARRMQMSANRLNEIVAGKRGVTAETAIYFGALTGTSPQFWMHLQADHDLWIEMQKTKPRGIEAIAAATGVPLKR